MSASGYIDKQHRSLARELEDLQRNWRVIKRLAVIDLLVIAACVAAVIGSGFVAAAGIPYVPAALAWTGSALGVAAIVVGGGGFLLAIEDSDRPPWTDLAHAQRKLDDYVEDKVMDDDGDKPKRSSWGAA